MAGAETNSIFSATSICYISEDEDMKVLRKIVIFKILKTCSP